MCAGYKHRTTLATAKKLRLKPGRAKTTVLVLADPHACCRPRTESQPRSHPTPSPQPPPSTGPGDRDERAQDRHDADPATAVRCHMYPGGVGLLCVPFESLTHRTRATDTRNPDAIMFTHAQNMRALVLALTSTHARPAVCQLKIRRLLERRAELMRVMAAETTDGHDDPKHTRNSDPTRKPPATFKSDPTPNLDPDSNLNTGLLPGPAPPEAEAKPDAKRKRKRGDAGKNDTTSQRNRAIKKAAVKTPRLAADKPLKWTFSRSECV